MAPCKTANKGKEGVTTATAWWILPYRGAENLLMEETFQCLGFWKVDCLRAELSRLTDIVKVMGRGGRVIARKTNGERTTEK